MSTYTDRLHLMKPEDGNVAWGTGSRALLDAIDLAIAPKDCYFVSPDFLSNALGNVLAVDRRHFSTIQAAIDAAEQASATSRRTIVIYPGEYGENLTITGSVALVGAVPAYAFAGGVGGVEISGVTSVRLPTITLTPPSTHDMHVHLANLTISNRYNVATSDGTFFSEPMLIAGSKPVLYGGTQYHRLSMDNVWGIGLTMASFHRWSYAMKFEGNWRVSARNSEFFGSKYCGGYNNGGITNYFGIFGDTVNSKDSGLRIHDCRSEVTYQNYSLSDVNFPTILYGNNATVVAHRSTFFGTDYIISNNGIGTNNNLGLNAGDKDAWGNLIGIESELY